LSEEQQERIEIDIDNNNGSFESSDITEVVEVVENPNTETFPLSSKEEEDQKNEIKTDDSNRYK
jgi:hypothetical protein